MTHPFYRRFSTPALAAAFAFFLLAAGPNPATAAAKIVATGGAPIEIEVSKGRLIHLDQPADSVFVADPTVADVQVKSPSLIYLVGKGAGQTTLYAVGENDQVLLNATVIVNHDISGLEQAIHELDPQSAVSVTTVANSLVLEGTVYSAAEGDDVRRLAAHYVPDPKQLINKMKVDTPNQVSIRVRVAEMQRNVVKQFGFNWQSFFGEGNFVFGLATGAPVLTGASNAFNILRPSVAGGTSTVNNVVGGFNAGRTNVNTLIDALEDNGLVSILAEPNLSAVSGEPASFLAGGEFPIPVPSGLGTTSIDFKKYGVSLNFVATILGNDRISLHVQPEVSQLDFGNAITIDSIKVPALTTRRAETTIDLGSGESFAIAGLLQNNVTQDLSKFPWLGDVPVLGALFRSTSFQHNESELVIIVTPYLVHPAQTANRMQAPTDGFAAPNDEQRVMHGDQYRQQSPGQGVTPQAAPGTTLIGPGGFDLN